MTITQPSHSEDAREMPSVTDGRTVIAKTQLRGIAIYERVMQEVRNDEKCKTLLLEFEVGSESRLGTEGG